MLHPQPDTEHVLKKNHPPAAFGIFHVGIGNYLYGLEQIQLEYVTTEWVTFFGLPVYPVASWTVHDSTDRWDFTYLSSTQSFEVSRRSELNMSQVLRGYTITGLFVVFIFLLPYLLDFLIPAPKK